MSVKDSIPESENWWDDPDFQNKLVALLIQDQQTLKNCAALLSPDDFKPGKGLPDGHARWLVAERALEHFEKHNTPLGSLVRADVLEYASQLNLGSTQVNGLRDYLKLLQKIKPTAPDALVEKVIRFKSLNMKKVAINEFADLLSVGQLTDEKWDEISNRIQSINNNGKIITIDYLKTLENRIERRINDAKRLRTPLTFIEPLDIIIKNTVGRKQVGLVLAPYKRGKSTFLLWLTVALSLQRLNILYVTLEDTADIVEDRLDSIVTSFMGRSVSLKNLKDKPRTLRQRFERFKNTIHSQIRVFDGTGGGVTISTLEKIVRMCRDEGFIPDAIITDYDEEIQPSRRFKEKRFEIDEIYRAYRALCSKYNMIGWLAAQTQRNTRHLKILSGDKAAEDIGKAKKVTCCLSMGKGDTTWGEDSIYLWVAASKTDRMDIGCHIVPDLERALVYDRDATNKAAKINAVANTP